MSLIANLDAWKKLTPAQREFLTRQALSLESRNEYWKVYAQQEAERQAKAGIQVIKLDAAQSKQYVDRAYETGWAGIIKVSPQHGPKMRELFTKR